MKPIAWSPGYRKCRSAGRRAYVVVLGTLIAVTPSACGDPETVDESQTGGFADTYALPFGLNQVAGTRPIGRPAVFDEAPLVYHGKSVTPRSLRAAYEVEGDDPVAVFQSWVEQLNVLHLGEVLVQSSAGTDEHQPWLYASGFGWSGDGPEGDSAYLQLWTTNDRPVLLVDLQRYSEDGSATISPDRVVSSQSPSPVVTNRDRSPGDVLFEEQGQKVGIPADSEPLMGTIPTSGGTGGSYSILSAVDGRAAVQALLDDAVAGDEQDFHEVEGPTTNTVDGVEVTTGFFVIPAGGWLFNVVAIPATGDPLATVYVTSAAD